jgi:subtilisin family serine protease
MSRALSGGSALAFALLCALHAGAAPDEAQRRAFAAGVAKKVLDQAVVDTLASAEWARVVIVFEQQKGERPGKHPDAAIERLAPLGLVAARRFNRLPVLVGYVNARALAALIADPHAVRISLDAIAQAQLAQAVPLVKLDALRNAGLEGAGAQVAILDTGVDLDHPDLTGAVVAQHCFCEDNVPGPTGCCPNGLNEQSGAGSAQDDHGHGTRVAGVVTSAGAHASLGGAPDAQLVAVKVLNAGGGGSLSDILAGLDWVLTFQPNVTVVNMSLAANLYPGDCDTADAVTLALATAIDQLYSAGALTVAGAGNNGSGTEMSVPACIAKSVSVGAVWDANVGSQSWYSCTDATTAVDQVACWSNTNAKTDVVAPGALMTSSLLNGATSTSAGTSYAAPTVAACAAVLAAAHPSATLDQISGALETSGTTVVDAKNGLSFPRLDCLAAHRSLSPEVPSLPASAWLPLAAALAGAGALAQASIRRRRTDARAPGVR